MDSDPEEITFFAVQDTEAEEPVGSVELNDDSTEEVEKSGYGIPQESVPLDDEQGHVDGDRLTHLPLSRVRTIMKTVPSVHIINTEALVLIERASVQFLRELCADVHQATLGDGKKTVSRAHVDQVIKLMSQYEFLDGMLD
ncbi:DNA polymerase epsilon subunit 4 [Clonorchis sinensis]|uniref:DNA polymerase epsilon subunit 4 n=1 Tax=Clonorchis sinensis TaxID=79923 RepID=A0A8T1MRP7_CLOSI|nr:DNA polymerase epsilon subunit 4 [Clonorchis sinensis]